jgi:hypothetical protein
MDDSNLDHGNLFDLGDKICDLIDEICGIPRTVILDGHEVQVRVEIKND